MFRTDSSGKDYLNERLYRVCRAAVSIDHEILEWITEIEDHKGHLIITIEKDSGESIDLVSSLFEQLWKKENEVNVTVKSC